MKRLIKVQQYAFVIFALFCCPGILTAAPSFAGEANVYVAVEQFVWKEFNNDGSQLLKESGPRYGVGFTYNFEFRDHHLILKPRVEIIGGVVDYDGATQAGVPVKTDTTYFGGKLEVDLGWRFGSLQKTAIEPFGGIGLRGWYRDIKDATASNGTPAYGYTEEWYTIYLRAGLRGDIALGEAIRLFAEAGGKLPVNNENTAHFSDAGLGPDVTLKPGNEPSLFAEAGIKYKFFKTSIYYDSMRFSKSDVAYSGGVGFYQPKSQADMYGIRLGASF
jgi:hypothetical protein